MFDSSLMDDQTPFWNIRPSHGGVYFYKKIKKILDKIIKTIHPIYILKEEGGYMFILFFIFTATVSAIITFIFYLFVKIDLPWYFVIWYLLTFVLYTFFMIRYNKREGK